MEDDGLHTYNPLANIVYQEAIKQMNDLKGKSGEYDGDIGQQVLNLLCLQKLYIQSKSFISKLTFVALC